MSTRGALGYSDGGGEIKATYNHSDSYPEGLGQDVFKFIKKLLETNKIDEFENKMKKVKWVLNDDPVPPHLVEKYQHYYDNVSTCLDTEWYALLRNVQGIDGFEAINNGQLEHLIESTGFMLDSLFCEWAYIVNFRNATLDVWTGFQKCDVSKEYQACKRIACIKFSDILTHDSIMDFLPPKEE
jgi:hypothetical protein